MLGCLGGKTDGLKVTIAMTAGRPSIYDTEIYLTATGPAALSLLVLTSRQSFARAMMHILVQCPRLVLAIRYAIRDPGDASAISAAILLAEILWSLACQRNFVKFIDESIRVVHSSNDGSVSDILLYGIEFDVAQNMVLVTRYWLLRVFLCGTLDTLHRRFPGEFAQSLLPNPALFHSIDTCAAMQLGRAILALGPRPSALTLIRTHGPFSGSIGAWHRLIRYLSNFDSSTTNQTFGSDELRVASRMKNWGLAECDAILSRLNITKMDEEAWMEALDCMAGEELVDWIPSKVSFIAEDGEMVMKLEYSDYTAHGDPRVHSGPSRVFNIRNPAQFGPKHLKEWAKSNHAPVIVQDSQA